MNQIREVIGVALFLLASLFCAHQCAGCKPPGTPREEARATITLIAHAVHIADQACASVAYAQKNLWLADECAIAYEEARINLHLAEDALDIADEVAARNMPCAVEAAVDALGRIKDRLHAAGGKVPPTVEDALKLAPILTVPCRG